MEKIIILSGQPGRSEGLVSLLNRLFPECDISIVSGIPATDEEQERRHEPTDEPADSSRAQTED